MIHVPTENYPAESEDVLTRTGYVEHMQWTKSPESWHAGGSDYFVLVCDDKPPEAGPANRLVLRPTDAHSFESFLNWVGKRVEIRGRKAGYIRFNKEPIGQTLVERNFDGTVRNDGTSTRGGGLLVDSVKAIDPSPQDLVWQSRGTTDPRSEWFRDAKFGAIIHFGPYSTLGGYYEGKGPFRPAEQIMALGQNDRRAHISPADYKAKVAANFNPTKFDAAKWVSLMKAAGQKYVILTTKHHDGFCMFKTATTSYNVVDSTPFGRDIVKEVADECRKQGLVFCPYYSIGDWAAKDVQAPGFATYKDYMHAQLKELLTNYGETKLLWFDNWWYVDNQWHNDEPHAKDLYAFARNISPNTLVNDRCGNGDNSGHGDYATPENQLKGSLQSRYFEVVMTNTSDDNWGWVKGATNYRTPGEIIKNLIDSVSKGGNFVLNVGPNADGEFPPEHVALLAEIGKWTSVNGEAIYGCVPAPEVKFWSANGVVAYATKAKAGDAIYVHVVSWPEDERSLVVDVVRSKLSPDGLTGELLDGSLGKLESRASGETAVATLLVTRPSKVDPYATVIKLTFIPPQIDGPLSPRIP